MEKELMQLYLDGLNENDPAKVAEFLADECYFSDGATRVLGVPDNNQTTKAGVEAAFKASMSKFKMSSELIKMNDHSMEYIVRLNDKIALYCVGAITVKDGKAVEYIARPL